jgi:hypothetical protein
MSKCPLDYPVGSANEPQPSRSGPPHSPVRDGTVGGVLGSYQRLGRQGRARLRAELSARDLAILADVDRFRLLSARQIETLHFATAATPLTAARTARRALRRLVDWGLLKRLERRVGGLYGGSAAFVYGLTDAGQRLLNAGEERPRRRLREPGLLFVQHTLAIAELAVGLVSLARSTSDLEVLDLQAEPTCWRQWTRPDGGREVLRPDLYLALGAGQDELRWFVEVDLGSEHLPTLRRKCLAYQRYYDSGHEQVREGVFPQVLWAVPDERRRAQLEQLLRRERGLTTGLFAVTTLDAAVERLRQ